MIPQLNFSNIPQHFLTFYTASNNQSHLTPHMKELPQLQFITLFCQVNPTSKHFGKAKSERMQNFQVFYFKLFPLPTYIWILTLI